MTTQELCQVTGYRLDDELLIQMAGSLRLENSEMVRARIMRFFEEPATRVMIDMSRLGELDSAGLGVLVGLHMKLRKDKREFSVVSPMEPQMQLLKATRLNSIFKIVAGIEGEVLRNKLARTENAVALPEADA